MTAVLEVRGVSVAFGGVQALEDVSFELREGELLGLMGPNGAGKTTAMRAITGVVTPQEGEVRLRGRRLNGLAVERRVRLGLGMSQQIVKPFRSMTVVQNVALAAGAARTANPLGALFQTGRGAETARARELLELVGIGEAADASPSELPLGFLKRLEVARALALDPQLLLLDEPLAGLNQAEAATFADVITGLNRGGLSIILIEHNLGEVLRICSRLVVLDNGRNLKSGAPLEVMADPAVRAAYLGEGGDDAEAG
ncbi:MAG: ATP-binding cassette domain-containing protein [Hyphomicrobiales bacterium]|nr:ATP-binding cassette domain-containing protein [Hyphomicrobiales bacterium]MCP5372260.1 ATP-binding cassette domain-containing protein [Hyphomicrobiales bacterium]